MANNIGKITQIIGAVLDIKFTEGNLPEINDAIKVPTKDGKELEERARVIANQTLKEALRGITVEELSISQEVLRKIFFNTKD